MLTAEQREICERGMASEEVDNWAAAKIANGSFDGALVELAKLPARDRSWRRRRGYGNVEDQLDMLYWDQVNGTSNWKSHVASVKAAHP